MGEVQVLLEKELSVEDILACAVEFPILTVDAP